MDISTEAQPALRGRTISLLLVDDHPVVRAGYARLLELAGDMRVVAEAGSAEQALECCYAGPPVDVVVTDLSMPGAGGLELIRRLLARSPQARVLVFSMHDGAALLRRAFEAGARGFVSKSSSPQRLVQAVREVAAGRRAFSDDAFVATAGAAADAVGAPGERLLARLTEREFALFRLLAQGHPLADCARLLGLSAKTASNYQSLIRDKLGVSTSAALTHLAIRCGVIASTGE